MKTLIRTIFIIAAMTLSLNASASLSIEGSSRHTSVTPPRTSGLESVIVIENTANARLVYTATSAGTTVVWKRFSSMGGGYAEDLGGVSVSGATSSITPSKDDMGYIIEENGRQTAYWVVNYANHTPTLSAINLGAETECDRAFIEPSGGFDRILYYSINGAPIELDREVRLEYTTLELDAENSMWNEVTAEKSFAYIDGIFTVEAPLRDTRFTLVGDRFLNKWGRPVEASTTTFVTHRVSATTSAVQTARDNDNEQKNETSGLGGSAPCEITFRAVPTDATVFREWQFAPDEAFSDILDRFNQDEFTYTFNEYGTTYVRYVCADAEGGCTYESDVYTVMVGESKIECPNAFSPANEDGVNDEWKVSYSSIVSFECHIFSRWGKELFSTRNPAEGWNGKVGGKFVPSGVYFYVIKAEGADGKHYNLSGDINIVGSRLDPNGSSAPTE